MKIKTRPIILPLILFALLLTLIHPAHAGPPPPPCTAVIVQADDWLSKIALKHLGDPMAYPVIIAATNQAARADTSYATIDDPDLIEPGQKLCVPPVVVQQFPANNVPRQSPASIAGENDVEILYEEYMAKWAFRLPDGKVTACYARYVKSRLPNNIRSTATWDCATSDGQSTPSNAPRFEGPKS